MDFRACTRCGTACSAAELRCPQCGGELQAAGAEVLLGQRLGKYELLSVIGRGGMGVVLKGRHATLGNPVAIKLLLPGLGDPTFAERFRHEARLLASLRHPHIVEIHDFDVSAGGLPYYVMEYLEGETLSAELARAPEGLAWTRILAIVEGLAGALQFAHERGVVHRDLKPDNIFIARQGSTEIVKLLDFGIARVVGGDEAAAGLTQTGHVIGTPRYFAPEQFFGYAVGPATDQYALALIVGEMASGKPLRGEGTGEAFAGDLGRSAQVLARRMPADSPPVAVAALGRALSVDPDQRFPSVAELARALAASEAPAATHVMSAPRTSNRGATAPAPRGRLPLRAGWLALAGALLLVGAALAGWWWMSRRGADGEAGKTVVEAGIDAAGLRLRDELPVAVDAQGILTRVRDIVVLASADGWYLQPLGGGAEPGRVVLPPSRRLLGALEGGRLAVVEGNELLAVDPLKGTDVRLARLPANAASAPRLWLSPDARTLVATRGSDGLVVWRIAPAGVRQIASLDLDRGVGLVAISRDWIAVLSAMSEELRVYRSSDASRVLEQPLTLGRAQGLRLLDAPPRLAVASNGPEVLVFPLDAAAGAQTLSVARGASALAWLADYPTLLLAGPNGMARWRDGATEQVPGVLVGSAPDSLLVDGGEVLALDSSAHRLVRLEYGRIDARRQYQAGTSEGWAVHVDAESGDVYMGSRDGLVHRLHDGALTSHPLHADGVTALVGDTKHLASASDDRTLAIWRLPDMDVQWRSRGHDYLVNYLELQGSSLWSSSSDGALKRWRWSTLEPEESIDLRALTTDPELSLHAFHVMGEARRILVGSWNRRLVWLERQASGRWKQASWRLDSDGVYHMVELSTEALVMVLGIEPTRLHVFDLRDQSLYDLPDFGVQLLAMVEDRGGQGVYLLGRDCVGHYEIERAADGNLRWRAAFRIGKAAGDIEAADRDARRGLVWAADDRGHLLAFDPDDWHLPPPQQGVAARRERMP